MISILIYSIVIPLVIAGLVLWGLRVLTPDPIDATISKVIRVVTIVIVCIWVLYGVVSLIAVMPPLHRI